MILAAVTLSLARAICAGTPNLAVAPAPLGGSKGTAGRVSRNSLPADCRTQVTAPSAAIAAGSTDERTSPAALSFLQVPADAVDAVGGGRSEGVTPPTVHNRFERMPA
jgi:hypothetical protein